MGNVKGELYRASSESISPKIDCVYKNIFGSFRLALKISCFAPAGWRLL